jgi:hypothetical protein
MVDFKFCFFSFALLLFLNDSIQQFNDYLYETISLSNSGYIFFRFCLVQKFIRIVFQFNSKLL